jgi:hypothetical protein
VLADASVEDLLQMLFAPSRVIDTAYFPFGRMRNRKRLRQWQNQNAFDC